MYAMPINEDSLVGTDEDDNGTLHVIKTLSVSPQSKMLMCVVKKTQLFWAPMDEKATGTANVQNEVTST